MNRIATIVVSWLPLAATITVLSVVIYAAVQQNYRQSLNDPQIQMAEDAASGDRVPLPAGFVNTSPIDIATSISPWIAVYDQSSQFVSATVFLNGKPFHIPLGVLEAAKANNGKDALQPYENRVTWQPQEGVRQAIVVVWSPENKRFFVAGRNMREVETREKNLGFTILCGWLLALAVSFALKAQEWYFLGIVEKNHGRS